MYWLRTESIFPLFAWLLLITICWLGGWLLTTHLFRLHSRERLLTGLALSLLLLIVLANILTQLLTWAIPGVNQASALIIGFWSSGVLILGLGTLSGGLYRSNALYHQQDTALGPRGKHKRKWLDLEDLKAWPQLLAFGSLLLLFILINRGLAIFDDYHNLPLVSTIAAGDLPPHFYLDSEVRLAYHYGLHLFAASLMRLAGQFPWSAFDLSKSITIALSISLAWLWFRRVTHRSNAAYWGALLVTFGGGTRWALLFFPESVIKRIGTGLELLGSALATGPDLNTVLLSQWKIEGGGPLPFPFAFINSIQTPLNMALGGSGALATLTIILLLLIAHRSWRLFDGLIFGLVIASLALTAEHIFAMILVGVFITAVWIIASASVHQKLRPALIDITRWGWVFLPALALSFLAGGVITETIAAFVNRNAATVTEINRVGGLAAGSFFRLRWPPAITSSHFGPLAITNSRQLIIAIAELGPAILIAPFGLLWSVRQTRRGQWLPAWIMFGSIVVAILSLFVYYTRAERDTSRLLGSALGIWVLLGFPIISLLWGKMRSWMKMIFIAGYAATILSGIVLFAIQMIAITRPQFTYFVDIPDALLSQKYWDYLAPGAEHAGNVQIFDLDAPRAVTLFGQPMQHAFQDQYTPFPEWSVLGQNFDPKQIAQAGFSYIYIDKETWQNLTYQQKQSLQQPCVKKYAEEVTEEKDFRWILDIRECQ